MGILVMADILAVWGYAFVAVVTWMVLGELLQLVDDSLQSWPDMWEVVLWVVVRGSMIALAATVWMLTAVRLWSILVN